MPHDVFLSYAHDDKAIADGLCAVLERNGIRCWISPRDILPGKNWGESIMAAIEASRVLVLLFSSRSNQSKHVVREVERAVHHGLFVVPFRLEDVPPSKAMEYYISSPHWLDALTPPVERHMETLAAKIKILLAESPGDELGATRKAPVVTADTAKIATATNPEQITSPRRAWALGIGVAAILTLVAAALVWRRGHPPTPTEIDTNSPSAQGDAPTNPPPEKPLEAVKPAVVSQTEDLIVKRGSPATLAVRVSGGEPLRYAWDFQPAAGTGWRPLVDETNDSLKFPAVRAVDEGTYRIRISNSGGSVEAQLQLKLQPVLPPKFVTLPQPMEMKERKNATFSADVTGELPLNFEWQFRSKGKGGAVWEPVAGATGTNIMVSNLRPEDSGEFRIVASNEGGAVTSPPVFLKVIPLAPPSFADLTLDNQAYAGEPVVLKPRVEGDEPMTFVWQRLASDGNNWTRVEAGREALLKLESARPEDQGRYRLIASNTSGVATSGVFNVSMLQSKLVLRVRASSSPGQLSAEESQAVQYCLAAIESQLRDAKVMELDETGASGTTPKRGYQVVSLDVNQIIATPQVEKKPAFMNLNGVNFVPKAQATVGWRLKKDEQTLTSGQASAVGEGPTFKLPFKGKSRNGFIEPTLDDARRHMIVNNLVPVQTAFKAASSNVLSQMLSTLRKLNEQVR